MLKSRNNSLVFVIAYLYLTLVFYILRAIIVYIFYMLDIPLCFTYIVAWDCLLNQYSTKRVIVAHNS